MSKPFLTINFGQDALPMIKYAKFKQRLNELTHTDRTHKVEDWSVVDTNHGGERKAERTDFTHEDHMGMLKSIHSKVKNFDKPGEYMFTSRTRNRSYVMNVAPEHKQLRVITILPKNKHIAKPGTKKIMMESYDHLEEIFID